MVANTAVSYENGVHAEADETQYLTFQLGGEFYGVDILKVQEIRGWTPATVIPNAPAYIKGVINLRGSIVPVIDLRLRLQMPVAEYTDATVVIILSVQREGHEQTVGLVVDSVSDVLNIADGEIREVPKINELDQAQFLGGIASHDEGLVLVLDANLLFDNSELDLINRTVAN
jgi:purine-binding chemotaxis protein CheW